MIKNTLGYIEYLSIKIKSIIAILLIKNNKMWQYEGSYVIDILAQSVIPFDMQHMKTKSTRLALGYGSVYTICLLSYYISTDIIPTILVYVLLDEVDYHDMLSEATHDNSADILKKGNKYTGYNSRYEHFCNKSCW